MPCLQTLSWLGCPGRSGLRTSFLGFSRNAGQIPLPPRPAPAQSSLPTVISWCHKPTARGFCREISRSPVVPAPRITPRDVARMESELPGSAGRRRALPGLAPLGCRMPPGTGFQGHVTLQPGCCQQPSPALAEPLACLLPAIFFFFLRQLIAPRESQSDENWQERADIRFIHHQF